MTYTAINEEIKVAIEALKEGWDWAQDFRDENGDRHVIDGPGWIEDLPDERSLQEAREYNAFVESAYSAAIEELKKAAGLLESDDIAGATEAASAAARFERETGDDMFCRPILEKIEEIDEDGA